MALLDRLVLPLDHLVLPSDVRRAAVGLLVTPDDRLLFIKRAERVGDLWSGHVAFPGGREDPGDESLVHTALREVQEEIGLDLSGAKLIGTLPPQGSPQNAGPQHVNVIPFVFLLASQPEPAVSDEVSDFGFVPLAALLAREGRSNFLYRWQGADYELPCVDLPFGRLWGMTLRMVDDLVERLDGHAADVPWPPREIVPTDD